MSKSIVCGLDECGRGALAGPLVAAAVVITNKQFLNNCPIPIRDSKKLTPLARTKLVDFLRAKPIVYKIASIAVDKINDHGISWANKQIFLNLVNQIKADQYIVDGNINFSQTNITSQVKADNDVLEVSLASIIAKVYRDNLMAKLGTNFPHYCWHQNAGYGTLIHRQAISTHGPCPHHRTLFIRKVLSPT